MRTTLILWSKLLALPAILTLMVGIHFTIWGVHRYPKEKVARVPAARPHRGPLLIRDHGCAACHTVPGVPGATGKVGPRLDRMSEQVYIAGVLPNSAQNLAHWIQHPRSVNPHTAMPDLDVDSRDARDIAAYLYSLP